MKTTDDLECETALREISVTGRSTGAGTSTAGESDDRPGVARLRSSVASIATLTPDRLAGGFGIRIARKRSPIELSFLSPAVAPPDGESVDDPELSIVSPSPFARPDHHEDAFTYLTQSGRSGRGSQSDDSVGPVSDSATQSPAERVFRSDRRSQPYGSRTSDRAQTASREHDGPERRDGIRSSERAHRRGDVEAGAAARSNGDAPSTSGAKSGPMPGRSGPVDDDRPRQSTGRTGRRQRPDRGRSRHVSRGRTRSLGGLCPTPTVPGVGTRRPVSTRPFREAAPRATASRSNARRHRYASRAGRPRRHRT